MGVQDFDPNLDLDKLDKLETSKFYLVYIEWDYDKATCQSGRRAASILYRTCLRRTNIVYWQREWGSEELAGSAKSVSGGRKRE
jgi:hypothetical protein